MRNKKRILISACLILLLLTAPFYALACPHIDENGEIHWQFHNEDYTIMTKLYPREHHLLSRVVEAYYPNLLLTEVFSFPLKQSQEAYIANYAFVNDVIFERGIWSCFEDVEFQTTVEGVPYWRVAGTDFDLRVGLANTFQVSGNYVAADTYEMHYNIHVTRMHDELNNDSMDYQIIHDFFHQAGLVQASPELLRISTNLITTTHDFQTEQFELENLHDPIDVRIFSTETAEDVVAVNFARPFHSGEVIPVTFDTEEQSYSFTIEESGIFALVNADFDPDRFDLIFYQNATTAAGEDDDGGSNGPPLSFVVIPLLAVGGLGGAAIFVKKNREPAPKKGNTKKSTKKRRR